MAWFDPQGIADPLERAVAAPYVRRCEEALAQARFATLVTPTCREKMLWDFAHGLWLFAREAAEGLVSARLAGTNPLWGLDVRLAPEGELRRAREAVARMVDAMGLEALAQTAPLLADVLARQTERFASSAVEMCERVSAHQHQIAAELLGGGRDGDLGMVVDASVNLLDTHDGGRRTNLIACEAGTFVYKPHDCQVERWFADVAQHWLPGVFRQPATILAHDAGGSFGLQEFVERTPVIGAGGVGRYWHNMGQALALFQMLGSEDLHAENFVAAGERPSLIDAETVLAGDPADEGDPFTNPSLDSAAVGFTHDLAQTLVGSSLLPCLGGRGGNVSPLFARGLACLPVWEGVEHDVRGHEDELLEGFDEGLRRLAACAEGLARDVDGAEHMPVRRLIRDTGAYDLVLARLRRADAYRPELRGQVVAMLARPLVRGVDATRTVLAKSEAACLLDGDVPYFHTRAGSRTIVAADGLADDGLLRASALERAHARIAALDAPRRSFARGVLWVNLRGALVEDDVPVPACVPAPEPLPAPDALSEAARVFCRLASLALEAPSGAVSWVFREGEAGALCRSGVGLADGLAGVVVFLAALASKAWDEGVRDEALVRLDGCLDRMEAAVVRLEAARTIPEASVPLGLARGLGGILCATRFVADVTCGGCGRACERARFLVGRLLGVLGRVDVEAGRSTGVYAGSAGLLLALARCGDAGGAAARAVAERLVQHLLDSRVLVSRGGVRLWDTCGTGWPVSGLGYGQAGIAAALSAACGAFDLAGRSQACDAVRDALTWELGTYRQRRGVWPDLRGTPVSDKGPCGLGTGAPGIGLCALAVRDAWDAELTELANAILCQADEACAKAPTAHRDSLDSGTLARVEYLLARGRRQDAGRLLAGVVRRADALGSYVLVPQGLRLAEEPDLMRGLSGVGYALVRYAAPELPSVFA